MCFFFVLMDGLSLVFIFCLLFFCGWVLSPNILHADGAMRSFFVVYNVWFSWEGVVKQIEHIRNSIKI